MSKSKFDQTLFRNLALMAMFAGSDGQGEGGEGEGEGQGEGQGKGEGEGKLSDADAKLLKENMKRKEQLAAAQAEIETLKRSAAALAELGDVEELKAMLSAKKEAETKALEAKGDFERLRTRMAEEHGKVLKKVSDESADLKAKLTAAMATIDELTIGASFSNSQFINGELTLTPSKARMIYGDHFDLVDGKVVGFDKPRGAAGRTQIVDQYGTAVEFEAAMRQIIEADPDVDSLVKAKGKQGAASGSKNASQKAPAAGESDSLSRIKSGLKGLF